MIWNVVILISVFQAVKPHTLRDYCKLSCKNALNTICLRSDNRCGISIFTCGISGKSIMLNDDERTLVLNLHNSYRDIFASGEDKRGNATSASNINVLSYSKELEFIAQCHSNACVFAHDKCRISPIHGRIGQNSFKIGGDETWVPIEASVKGWYEEIDKYVGSHESFHFDYNSAHFTQVIWAETEYVGCGRTLSDYYTYFFCNYAPVGNVVGKPIYKVGAPCSQCKNGTCSKDFAHLCEKSKDIDHDLEFIAPFLIPNSSIIMKDLLVNSFISILYLYNLT